MSKTENSTKSRRLGGVCIQRARLIVKPLSLALLIAFALTFILAACGSAKKVGTVTNFGQSIPAGGGLVQSYVTVKLDDDGTEVKAWLPQDDALWSNMQQGAKSGRIRVEIEQEGEFWKFVQVLLDD